jgi:hypothetical protein
VHPLLSPQAQLGAVEGLLAFVRATTTTTQSQLPALQLDGEGEEAAVVIMAERIREEVLNLRCPACRVVVYDFDACCAVTCGACGLAFCGLCLTPSSVAGAAAAMPAPAAAASTADAVVATQQKDAMHAHAVSAHGALFFSEGEIRRLQNRYRCVRSGLID